MKLYDLYMLKICMVYENVIKIMGPFFTRAMLISCIIQ
jgi:hypothetical protein